MSESYLPWQDRQESHRQASQIEAQTDLKSAGNSKKN